MVGLEPSTKIETPISLVFNASTTGSNTITAKVTPVTMPTLDGPQPRVSAEDLRWGENVTKGNRRVSSGRGEIHRDDAKCHDISKIERGEKGGKRAT